MVSINARRGNLDLGPADEKPVRTMITMEFPALFQRALLQCGMYAGGKATPLPCRAFTIRGKTSLAA